MKRLLTALWLAVAALGVGKVGLDLVWMLQYEARHPLNGDFLIYLTIGRGIVNGLRPYVDLFESKPPGIFYLSAFSVWLTDGDALARVLQAANLMALPALLPLYVWLQRRSWSPQTVALLGTAFMFGGLLALRAEENAGGMQSEVFGLLPVALYALSVVWPTPWTWTRRLLTGLYLLMVVAIREPFLLGIFAASLLTCRTWRQFVECFLLPATIAAVVGVIILFVLGLLPAYVTVYLPGMLANRIEGASTGPLFLRALWVHRFFGSLTTFSTMPLFGYLLAGLWLWSLVRQAKTRSILVFAAATAVAGAFALNQMFVLFTVLYKASLLGLSALQVFAELGSITAAYVVGGMLFAAALSYLAFRDWRTCTAVLCGLAALPLLSLSAGIGGYVWNYMLYAVPAFLALVLLFVRNASPRGALVVCVFLAVTALAYRQEEAGKWSSSLDLYGKAQEQSDKLEALMDACGLTRFVFAGSFPTFAFAKYSPIGPIFTPYFHDYLEFDHSLYQATYKNILGQGRILLVPTGTPLNSRDPLPEEIRGQFTAAVPDCARGLPEPPEFRVLYRQAQNSD